MPDSVTTGTAPASVLTVSVALRVPVADGVNVSAIVQLAPAPSDAPSEQVPARPKSPGFAPPIVRPLIVARPPPAFESVSVFAALVVPTVWLAKLAVVGESVGDGPVAALPAPVSEMRYGCASPAIAIESVDA